MADFGDIRFSGIDARRAHLALVEGGAGTTTSTASGAVRAASAAIGTDPVLRSAGTAVRRVATGYASGPEAPRSRHEQGVRAIAGNFSNFEDALLPMVLASGVSGEAAAAVAEAIMGNPALKAQAERAFQRARLNAV